MELISYSPSQKEAIEHESGALMLIAGPGSGKTFVITHKVRYMITKLGINPSNILVLTFSRAAAKEMEERFNILCEEDKLSAKPSFGTFHSIFFNLLKIAYGYRAEQIISDEDRYRLIKEIIYRLKLDTDDISTLSQSLLAEIALVKQDKLDIEYYYAKSVAAEVFKKVYKSYEAEKVKLSKLDFEDMLLMSYELLSKREDIRLALQQRYKYILIDEFQDINLLQYEVVKLMTGYEANICIVGDDDQSIYRFRGAKPEIMLNFHKDFPKLKKIVLDINFRSSKEIVEASLKLISHNKQRFKKDIKSYRGSKRPVRLMEFYNPLAQINKIIEDIKDYTASGYKLDEIAILFRTNLQARLLTKILMEHNISFVMKDSIPDIYEHWIAKDIKSYIKLAHSLGSREDVLRIINRPNRYIRREAVRNTKNVFEAMYNYYEDKPQIISRIRSLVSDLKLIKDFNVSRAIKYIRKAVGYDAFLKAYALEKGIDEQELFDILGELEESASDFETFEAWEEYMLEYRKELMKRISNSKKDIKEEISGLRLMTFHSSKGLEYDIVYIIDANEGISPHKKAKSQEEMEEERRMFYVAMTRAKDVLNICYCKRGFHKAIKPSVFLKELAKKD